VDKQRLIKIIKRHEGYRHQPYKDHLGNWTVGSGHLLHNDKLAPHFPDCKTVGALLDKLSDREQHDRWLLDDIEQAIVDARQWVQTFDSLSDARQEVLVEMCFQLGLGGVGKFVKTHGYIMEENFVAAANEMLDSRWAEQTPHRARELSDRMRDG
jgi:lysozyme